MITKLSLSSRKGHQGESKAHCSREMDNLGGIPPTFARSHLLALTEFSTQLPPEAPLCWELLPMPHCVRSFSQFTGLFGEAQCMLLSGMLSPAVSRKTPGSIALQKGLTQGNNRLTYRHFGPSTYMCTRQKAPRAHVL